MIRSFSLKNFDWTIFFCLLMIAAAGSLSLASTNPDLFGKQVVWYILGFAVILAGAVFDWKWMLSQPWFRWGVYGTSVALLLISNFQSGTIRGTKSWIAVGGIQFEPAELAKLGLIFLLADFFSRRHVSAWQNRNLILSTIYTAIPVFLIFIHPDFGSAAVVTMIWIGFLLMSGIHKKRFLIGLLLACVGIAVVWTFLLEDYQKDRLTAFAFPERDPFGINYNVIQSKIAIGSAGLFGKGFGQGTQTHLGFLPEAQTDFIFAAFVEEWGFIGGAFLLLIFFLLFYRIYRIGVAARGNYSKFIILGALIVLLTHFVINVGSNVGIMPVTGITFPFLSYGGSSILTTSVLISIIQHIKLESR